MTPICCRHERSDAENLEQGGLLQVRVQNTKLGISTFWSLDKFQNNMAAMRELDQVCFKSVLPFQVIMLFELMVVLMSQNTLKTFRKRDCFKTMKHKNEIM